MATRAANDRVSRVGECGEELNSHLANTSSVVFSISRGWGFNDIGTLLMEHLCFAIHMTMLARPVCKYRTS